SMFPETRHFSAGVVHSICADVINNELDKVAAGKGYVDLRNVSFEDSFTIPGLTLIKVEF
ncbi:hypothetical protein, partial [Lactobacillus helveticus]